MHSTLTGKPVYNLRLVERLALLRELGFNLQDRVHGLEHRGLPVGELPELEQLDRLRVVDGARRHGVRVLRARQRVLRDAVLEVRARLRDELRDLLPARGVRGDEDALALLAGGDGERVHGRARDVPHVDGHERRAEKGAVGVQELVEEHVGAQLADERVGEAVVGSERPDEE